MLANLLARLRDGNFLAALIAALALALAAVCAPTTLLIGIAVGAGFVTVIVFFAPVIELEVAAALDAADTALNVVEIDAEAVASSIGRLFQPAPAPQPTPDPAPAPDSQPAPAEPAPVS